MHWILLFLTPFTFIVYKKKNYSIITRWGPQVQQFLSRVWCLSVHFCNYESLLSTHLWYNVQCAFCLRVCKLQKKKYYWQKNYFSGVKRLGVKQARTASVFTVRCMFSLSCSMYPMKLIEYMLNMFAHIHFIIQQKIKCIRNSVEIIMV